MLRFICLLVFIIAFLTYQPSLQYDFTYDDSHQIVKNSYVRNADTSIEQIFSIFAQPTIPGDLYRPIVILSLRLNYLIGGLDPGIYHLTNITLHALICLLVVLVANNFFKSKSISFVAGFLFAIHPIHLEAVVNIYNRTELLAGLFSLLTLLSFDFWLRSKRKLALIFSLICFLLGLLSKESAFTILFILPLWIHYTQNKDRTKSYFSCLYFLLVFGIYTAMRSFVLEASFAVDQIDQFYHPENPLLKETFSARVLPALYLAGEYLRLLLFPYALQIDYSAPRDFFWDNVFSVAGIAAILITFAYFLAAFCLLRLKERSALFFIWIALTFTITINLFIPIGTIFAERLAYLPSAGFVCFMAYYLTKLRLPILLALLLSYSAFLISVNYRYMPYWENDLTLFKEAVKENPVSPKIALIYGIKLYKQNKYNKAIENFKSALFRDPTYTIASKYILLCYLKLEDIPKIRYWTLKTIKVYPNDPIILKVYKKIFPEAQQSRKN